MWSLGVKATASREVFPLCIELISAVKNIKVATVPGRVLTLF